MTDTFTLTLDDTDRLTLASMFAACAELDGLNEFEIELLRKVEALEPNPRPEQIDDYLR